jgi:hypothetical protein
MPEHRERQPGGIRGRVERSEFEARTAAQEHQAPLTIDAGSPTPPSTRKRGRRYGQYEPPHERSLGFFRAELERPDRLATVAGLGLRYTPTRGRALPITR